MRFLDGIIIKLFGGVRVRLKAEGSTPREYVLGKMRGMPPDRIMRIVRDIAPEAVGVVHVNHREGRLTISFSGRGFGDGFEQRLRNVLINS
jgi:hypothetical protein